MIICGLNCDTSQIASQVDSGGAAVVIDGQIVAAVAEERVVRKRYAGGFRNSLAYVLEAAEVDVSDVDAFYLSFYGTEPGLPRSITTRSFQGLPPARIKIVPSHHFIHAALAFFLSPFDEALIVVADNEGSLLSAPHGDSEFHAERLTYYLGRGNSLTYVGNDLSYSNAVGLGKFYSRITRYCGLGNYHNAGKLMGLAGYGKTPPALDSVRIWQSCEDGTLVSKFPNSPDLQVAHEWLLKYWSEAPPPRNSLDFADGRYAGLAAFAQSQIEQVLIDRIERLQRRWGVTNLCLSGGVALNSVANAKLEQLLDGKIFVPPYPSDEGLPLGDAIYGYLLEAGLYGAPLVLPTRFREHLFLGAQPHMGATKKTTGDAIAKSAQLLANGALLGWMRGRSEYGARALGARSILADPRTEATRDAVNCSKGREVWRPLAPAILEEDAGSYFFGLPSALSETMLGTYRAKSTARPAFAGTIHVDGTARLQTVARRTTPEFYDLIAEFKRITGVPGIINTSFNVAGEPIVETVDQALDAARRMNLDAVLLGDDLVELKKTTR